jgi:gallate decarboxylase subunit C
VLAKDPDTGISNASIHRFCVQGKDEMTISIYPGRHIGNLYEAALSKGENLPISINIGLDPAIYFASCFTEPLCKQGECELDIVGGLRQKAVEISDCINVNTDCISNAEIIIEAEITSDTCAENKFSSGKGTMPEFLGYQGSVKPGEELPIVKVKAITHRKNPIYQTLIGPGLEQSELQAITPEIATRGFLMQNFDLDVKEIVFNTAGGGLLMLVLQIQKKLKQDDNLSIQSALKILSLIPPLKHIFLVDCDIDPYSSEDLIWALTTRYQADLDMHLLTNEKPFLMDPSQTPDYRKNSDNKNTSVKALFDCTVPWELNSKFKRPFV